MANINKTISSHHKKKTRPIYMNKKAIPFSMNKGFTLLELILVIIIIGILGTLGFTQYSTLMEKSRGAEARAIIGDIRKMAYVYWVEYQTLTGLTDARVNIGTGADQIPGGPHDDSSCRSSHYFWYEIANANKDWVYIDAYRCPANGKPPQGGGGSFEDRQLRLFSNFGTGEDTWTCPSGKW